MQVLDRAVQIHGALGLADDTPLAGLWRAFRSLQLADGADEVHKVTVARHELRRWADSGHARAELGSASLVTA